MNVPTIGQGPGSVATLPNPQTGGQEAPARGPAVDTTVVRVGWFDLNGDGTVDSRSPSAGGDGTLIVPEHAHMALYSRHVQRQQQPRVTAPATNDAHTETSKTPDVRVVAPSDVQTRLAVDAYQRYGQPTDNTPTTDRAVA